MGPNLFLAGVPKCGTTALAVMLSGCPEIFYPGEKELNYYSRDYVEKLYYENQIIIRTKEKYEKLYARGAKYKYRMDGSISYFNSDAAIASIRNESPDAKVILVYRNPVRRAFSHFLMDSTSGYIKNISFSELIRGDFDKDCSSFSIAYSQIVDLGYYHKLTVPWIEAFGSENLFLTSLSDIKERPESVIAEIGEFLNISLGALKLTSVNESSVPKSPFVSSLYKSKIRKYLRHLLSENIRYKLKEKYFVKRAPEYMSDDDKLYLQKKYRNDSRQFETLIGFDILSGI